MKNKFVMKKLGKLGGKSIEKTVLVYRAWEFGISDISDGFRIPEKSYPSSTVYTGVCDIGVL